MSTKDKEMKMVRDMAKEPSDSKMDQFMTDTGKRVLGMVKGSLSPRASHMKELGPMI